MSTIKTVNVTTGKVLHYTIKKDGFKPVTGSKLITGNETININMVSSTSTDGAYVFGDRLGGVATFVGYFDSVDPNTQATQKYAYFVCDAQYRNSYKYVADQNNPLEFNLPKYESENYSSALNAKESATYNTNSVYDQYGGSISSGYLSAWYYTRNPNGQSLIVTVDGVPYSPQLPNFYELKQIYDHRSALDLADPTAEQNPTLTLSYWPDGSDGYCASSTFSTQLGFFCINKNGGYRDRSTNYWNLGVIPVFEIPVN